MQHEENIKKQKLNSLAFGKITNHTSQFLLFLQVKMGKFNLKLMHLKTFAKVHQDCKISDNPIGHLTGHFTPVSNFFCQENLTENTFSVQNRDTHLSFLQMKGLKSALAGIALVTSAESALAEDQKPAMQQVGQTTGQVENCGVFVKEQRELAKENEITMTRNDVITLLADCMGGKMQERIAEQERILAALDQEIREIGLSIDEKLQILDAKKRVLAKVIAVNGKLIIRAQELDQEIASALQKADEILQRYQPS